METAALIELPHWLVENGFSKIAAGVEVPIDYNKELPESYKIAELPECIMLHFQSGPYENKEDFLLSACGIVAWGLSRFFLPGLLRGRTGDY